MLYLASSSPRRAELLRQIGVKFKVVKFEIDETPLEGELPENLVNRLSRDKAVEGKRLLTTMESGDLLLAADTLIDFKGQVLGKPESELDCRSMLRLLSGNRHYVLSAVALINHHGVITQACSRNEVTFRTIKEQEIAEYCTSDEPKDKAGSYAIQGKAAIFIEHISGTYPSVMGLPLFETALLLESAGYNINNTLSA